MNRYITKSERARGIVNFKSLGASGVPDTTDAYRDMGPLPFAVNLEAGSIQNDSLKQVLWTGAHLQLALISLPVKRTVPAEVHPDTDEMIYVTRGEAEVEIAGERYRAKEGCAVFIPAGKEHTVKNTADRELKLFAVYAPPHHMRGERHP